MVNFIFALFYGVVMAFWRRWLGGGFAEKHKWLGWRGLQAIAGICLMIPVFLYQFDSWLNWIIAIVLAVYLYAQFWSRGHGACFDIGRDKKPSVSTVVRYNERWYHIPCDYLLPQHKYGFVYDFLYMTLRYTCPLLPLALLDCRFLLIGLCVSPIYAFCHSLSERESWLFVNMPEWLNKPVKWAELAAGFVFGFGIWMLR
jgi:hypothetical protein|nr:MAG TPA: hypothetical protein [Caudoviricetes sp.]